MKDASEKSPSYRVVRLYFLYYLEVTSRPVEERLKLSGNFAQKENFEFGKRLYFLFIYIVADALLQPPSHKS